MMHRTPALAAAIVAALAFGAPANAAPLLPDSTLNLTDYLTYQVLAGDPDWFGTELTSVTASANETRDGFIPGFGVVTDLYNVTAGIQSTVSRAANGQLVFKILPFADDASFAGINGAVDFSFSGFAGFDVDFGWTGVDPASVLVPEISRSADGDTIFFNMRDPRNAVPGVYEDLLFSVDAPSFTLAGLGSVDILIDTFGTTTRTLTDLPAPSSLPAPVPLPASGLALMLALGALGGLRRKA